MTTTCIVTCGFQYCLTFCIGTAQKHLLKSLAPCRRLIIIHFTLNKEMRNILYYNEDNTLRCNARDIKTQSFTSFDNSTIDLQPGKYLIAIDISATVTDSFYDAIDKSTETFTDSPFYISIKIDNSVQSFTIGQYTPICIHITRYLDLQSPTTITISSNYSDLQNVDIHVISERV